MWRFVAVLLLLAAVALGQWSEPAVLGDSSETWGGGPMLVPGRADTVWAAWVRKTPDYRSRVVARRFAGDSWGAPELLTPDSSWYFSPTGVLDDSGRVLLAFYNGSYPVADAGVQDSWGICTVTRSDTGWSRSEMAHQMGMGAGFPFDVRLGRDRLGGIGMVWEEGSGGMHHTGSVMLSRRTGEGWTERKRMIAGTPVTSYGGASLVPGDSTDFCLVYTGSRLEPPSACTAWVWTAGDTLVGGPASFAGGAATLARTQSRRYLALQLGDTLLASVDRGSGWEPPVTVATGLGYSPPALAADSQGFAWLAWADSLGAAVLASYHAGNSWSQPETVALTESGRSPQVAVDGSGCAHCCWLAAGTGGWRSVRWAYRFKQPGVEDRAEGGRMKAEARMPSIVHGVLRAGHDPFLLGEMGSCPKPVLLDISGRKVMDLKPGANDVSRLSPGVYFLREGSRGPGFEDSRVTKVVVAR